MACQLSELEEENKELHKVIANRWDKKLERFDVNVIEFLESNNFWDKLETGKRMNFLSEISRVSENKSLIRLIKQFMNAQACQSVLQAPDSEHNMFHRAGINVLNLLLEEIKRLDIEYKNMVKSEDKFDKYKILPE